LVTHKVKEHTTGLKDLYKFQGLHNDKCSECKK
jgi:hypothetical protein